MKQSNLFTKTSKNDPKDEVSLNAKLLLKGGFIDKELAGIYSFLPLGVRVLNKIIKIIEEEMDSIGGQKVSLTALQNPEVWKKTDRWDEEKMDVWFRTKLKDGSELGLAPTHEEPLSNLMRKFVHSYQDLPKYVYQFQTKFRNETRAKSGILRTREFIMKDLYSFSKDDKELDIFYDQCAQAYRKIYKRVGIGDLTYYTFASGGSFSKYSHEFQTVCEAGEDFIYLDSEKNIAINEEVYLPEVLKELQIDPTKLEKLKSIEVGNIFKLGTKYSKPLELFYQDPEGKSQPVVMGSYGIGPARLMGTVVELFSDEKVILWPKEIAPFHIHFLNLSNTDDGVRKSLDLYQKLKDMSFEVLFDDRQVHAGEKFADADLIGCPLRIVLSEKTISQNSVEIKKRNETQANLVRIDDLFAYLTSIA